MTRVSYFQRYSQRENHVTNNTLLILRHFYQASPHKIRDVFSELADADISIGLTFQQQVKESSSVPDALISQESLSIYIETKLGAWLEPSQLTRHIESISGSVNDRSKRVLFGLTTEPIEKEVREELIKKSKEEGLLQVGKIMSAFACRISKSENLQYQLYFQDPVWPSKARSKFIGLYSDKTISHLAEISSVVVGYYTSEQEKFIEEDIEKGELSEEQECRIVEAAKACTYYGNFAEHSHRYYLFDEVHETNFYKSSPGPMRRLRDFNLVDCLDYENQKNYSAGDVAKNLQGKSWE